jgi:hypothetical protein
MENFELKQGQVWKHYKGGMYKILLLAKNVEEGDVVDMVVYQRIDDTQPLTQSVGRFKESVDHNGNTIPRYEFISDN